MIDVDVVTDINESYAETVHGVTGNEIAFYLIAIIPAGKTAPSLAEPLRYYNLPVSITQDLGEFFFDMAEEHFSCQAGDEILLMNGKIDCGNLSKSTLVTELHQRAAQSISSQDNIIIKRRAAICSNSDTVINLSKHRLSA